MGTPKRQRTGKVAKSPAKPGKAKVGKGALIDQGGVQMGPRKRR